VATVVTRTRHDVMLRVRYLSRFLCVEMMCGGERRHVIPSIAVRMSCAVNKFLLYARWKRVVYRNKVWFDIGNDPWNNCQSAGLFYGIVCNSICFICISVVTSGQDVRQRLSATHVAYCGVEPTNKRGLKYVSSILHRYGFFITGEPG